MYCIYYIQIQMISISIGYHKHMKLFVIFLELLLCTHM